MLFRYQWHPYHPSFASISTNIQIFVDEFTEYCNIDQFPQNKRKAQSRKMDIKNWTSNKFHPIAGKNEANNICHLVNDVAGDVNANTVVHGKLDMYIICIKYNQGVGIFETMVIPLIMMWQLEYFKVTNILHTYQQHHCIWIIYRSLWKNRPQSSICQHKLFPALLLRYLANIIEIFLAS